MCPFCARSHINDLRDGRLGWCPGRGELGEPLGEVGLVDDPVAVEQLRVFQPHRPMMTPSGTPALESRRAAERLKS